MENAGLKMLQLFAGVVWPATVLWGFVVSRKDEKKVEELHRQRMCEILFGDPRCNPNSRSLLDYRREKIKLGMPVVPLEQWREHYGVSGKEFDHYFVDDDRSA